ncbi:Thylakoid formation1 protein, partial [Thalictrum thalictroides]
LDAQKVEEWARSQNASSIVEFSSREGEIEEILKDISERAASKGSFSYSHFFAVGMFRILELANARDPIILEKVRLLIIKVGERLKLICK